MNVVCQAHQVGEGDYRVAHGLLLSRFSLSRRQEMEIFMVL